MYNPSNKPSFTSCDRGSYMELMTYRDNKGYIGFQDNVAAEEIRIEWCIRAAAPIVTL